MVDFERWRQYKDDYFKVCDLLVDAWIMGHNSGYSLAKEEDYIKRMRLDAPEPRESTIDKDLEELVKEVGLDPKVVLRRLYCPQQTEDNGECSCQE